MRKLVLAAAAAAVIGLFAGSAWAASLPSSKAAVTHGDLSALGACATQGPEAGACIGPEGGTDTTDGTKLISDTGWHTVMQTFIKTPKNKDLSFDVALQCALVTFTEAKAKGSGSTGGSGKGAADGRIVVRVKVTPVDKTDAPVGTARFALPDNDGANALAGPASSDSDPQGVTYCFRFQELEVSFENLVCLFDETEEPDDECIIAVSLLLETLQAHAFNFILPDVSSDIQRIEVQGRAIAGADVFGGALSSARGEAFLGMGSTRIETLRLVKNYNPADGPIFEITDLDSGP